jgi:hypothetical protein
LVTGKVSGISGSVPGVPGGVPGTIGRGISTQGASWAVGGVKPALSGLAKPPTKAHVAGGGKNPKVESVSKWRGGILLLVGLE